jgi:hypothetical protein
VQSGAKSAVYLLAAVGVLFVLITPALDELPCTLVKHSHSQIAYVAPYDVVFASAFLSMERIPRNISRPRMVDVLSVICTLVC